MRYRSIDDLPMVCRYNLPEAALHVYRKVAPTPERFPRRPGVAAKRPLA